MMYSIPKRGCAFNRYQDDVETYNKLVNSVMRKMDITIIPLDIFTKNLASEMGIYQDGLHFSKFAQKQQDEFFAQEIVRFFISIRT